MQGTPGIGILSGIPFTNTPYQQAFENGLGSTPLYPNPQQRLGYNAARFNAGLTTLNADTQVTLIIAVGGIVAELPATHPNPQKDTISLVGGTLPGSANPGGHFHGRISLESVNTNVRRFVHLLQTFGIQHGEICLLSNPNSAMAGQERGGFTQSVTASIDEATTGPQATTAYTNAFGQIGATIKAVIVSADPWFKQMSNLLVPIANNWATAGKRVCYPLQEYANDAPKTGQTILYGPSLLGAYNLLGQLAAHVINPASPAPGQLQQVCRDI
jgi:hypothetical protein